MLGEILWHFSMLMQDISLVILAVRASIRLSTCLWVTYLYYM